MKLPHIDPDEIFLDAKNLPSFDTQQFEGRMEQAIPKRSIYFSGVFFLILTLLILGKAGLLQIFHGEAYALRAENNRLTQILDFPERGIIYDRKGRSLAWNEGEARMYEGRGMAHLLGYIGYPTEETLARSPDLTAKEFVGKAGIEKVLDPVLRGTPGVKIVETDVRGEMLSESVHRVPVAGGSVTITLDHDVNSKLFEAIKGIAESRGFAGGSGVILDVTTGEILAIVSYPEYDPTALANNIHPEEIQTYLMDERKPFLDRAVSGLYAPGSIVKPFMALGVLNENIISPEEEIFSAGFISIPNPFNPESPSIFRDWKAHGFVNMRRAIAVSSDVYFYVTGGGFEGKRGLGIGHIEEYARAFGFGAKTGIALLGEEEGTIPSPRWKARIFGGEPWRIGDTYNTVIGQYGFQVTPLQVARGIAAVANGGILVTPTPVPPSLRAARRISIPIAEESFRIVREGMRMAVTEGTAAGLNVHGVAIAAKTGTAQVGIGNAYANSWVTGFFPYETPRFAFAIVMERGPAANTVGALAVMREVMDWMVVNAPDYVD